APFAKKIARYLGTNHHELYVTEKDILDLIPKLSSIYDEPFGDSSALPTLLVSKMAKQKVCMTLSGDGGDELFMGYGAYRWAEKLNKPMMSLFRNPMAMALSLGNNRQKRAAQLLKKSSSDKFKSHIFSQEQYMFSEKEISQVLQNEYLALIDLNENIPSVNRKLNAKEQQALFDINYYLPDDLLVKVDRASMQYALETRVPLLDYQIVEFALNLNSNLKINQGESKWLLKQVLYDFVPASYFDRPKWGFGIPLAKWMQNDLKPYMESLLFTENEVVNTAEVKKLYQRFLNGETYLYNRLWLISRVNEFLIYNK
ncbi:MAG: asparagine synthase C-terminal domain-containing protein, partial [Bacteroidales bacterium]|nr:asparagine synthase C-terminal domain-containing protein [Bacteroidales bacterium]